MHLMELLDVLGSPGKTKKVERVVIGNATAPRREAHTRQLGELGRYAYEIKRFKEHVSAYELRRVPMFH